MELSSTESYERRVATFVLRLHARRGVGLVKADSQLSVEQDSAPRLINENSVQVFS